MTYLEQVYAVWERGVKQQGRTQAMRENVVRLYEARFGSVPEDLHTVLARIEGEDALRRILIVTGTRAADDVYAAVGAAFDDVLRQKTGVARTVVRDVAGAGCR